MLYRNGENLKSELIRYLSNKRKITIFSPYIKSKTLKKLLNSPNLNCEQIIVRWAPKDIALGSSDLEIYEICKEYSISLYINNRIHLKLYTDNFSDAFLGSANISERAICETAGNYEICNYVEKINRDDRLYLQKIINESILVTDEIYDLINSQISEITPDLEEAVFTLPNDIKSDDFLISKLPMIESPDLLWELYSEEIKAESQEQENCLSHDLALYRIETDITNKDDFFESLAKNFLKSPFIIAFLEAVDAAIPVTYKGRTKEGLQFGMVKKWFFENTTTAPIPRAWELTDNVKILYTWIEVLSNGAYTVSIPGAHSQVIQKSP